ncbi:hypothetical protein [Winogradskyella forsetii]|uniref:hypothetical protein n=1 Tax=Winogradskyella forsetii TaxID=2686077 RepID=UPI0015BC0335|nr:hypothetical protein [Winogradskyella forsetii]
MKTQVLGLIALGLTNLMIAQNDIAAITHSEAVMPTESKAESTVKNLNSEYLSLTRHDGAALVVKKLQNIVANYNIKTADVYQPKRNITYTVNFKEDLNSIDVIYNKDGKILSCKEHYQDVRLPYDASVKIAKQYPGWAFDTVSCKVSYSDDNSPVITYEVIIEKEEKTKKIRVTI